ncbi:MAG TPA: glycoside hydrolase family 130 protein [Terriglobia bacterium]|nr:glycoside hydrolase family 130 protein [Terriglobia bacterium]
MKAVTVERASNTIYPDRTRVLLRPFHAMSDQRAITICEEVAALPECEVRSLLEKLLAEFGERHVEIRGFFKRRLHEVRPYLLTDAKLSEERELLLGAYFSHEYSLEAAALFNPSLVPHPDQSGIPPGSIRFILSLRATGEGHVSSIVFRTGCLDASGNIIIDAPSRYSLEPAPAPGVTHRKTLFELRLQDLSMAGGFSLRVLKTLADSFTLDDLRAGIMLALSQLRTPNLETERVAREILALVQSNYEVRFTPDTDLSERVLFPATPAQCNGIEDARFVLFHNEDGTQTYYATYTAYNGKAIRPEFLETPDFLHFKFVTLSGSGVKNKGMALFPRKIKGKYAMLGRQDGENISVMFSDHLHFWHDAQLLLKPAFPWEFIQLGNCGSPIEMEAGWLVVSHGVGPMRKYCISAFLLDRDDPTQVIGRLREPLIAPNENEREGYVPNVVYSCGSLLHGRRLIVPYGISDCATTFATLSIDEVLAAMESPGPIPTTTFTGTH